MVRLLALGVALAAASAALAGEMLWDNYRGPHGFDGVTALSNERDSLISDTWVIDDAVFETPVRVEELHWIGLYDRADRFVAADYVVLDAEFSVVATMQDVSFGAASLGDALGLHAYEGTLSVDPIVLDAGQYYFGARLVGQGLGRNYLATSGTGPSNLQGATQAWFRGVPFGFDDWTPVEHVLQSGQPSDFSFQVVGTIVPEPAAGGALAALALLTLRRR